MALSGINDGYLSTSSDEGSLDGYRFRFVNNDGYECIFCLKIIRGFVELPCGHAGCDYCVEQWEKKHMKHTVCIVCNKIYNISGKQKSLYTDRLILHKRTVKCKQVDDGCQWEGTIDDYQTAHKKSCLLKKVKCKKCSASLKRVEQEKHETVCPCRNIKCLNCVLTYLFKDQKEHEDNFCFIPCEYTQYGCKVKVQFNKMEKHLSETARQHIEMVAKQNRALTTQNRSLTRQNCILATQNNSLTAQNHSLTTQNCSLTSQNSTPALMTQKPTLATQSPALTTQNHTLKKQVKKPKKAPGSQTFSPSSISSTNKRTYTQMASDENPNIQYYLLKGEGKK